MTRRGIRFAMAVGIAVLLPNGQAFAQALKDTLGEWSRDDGNARVRLAPCGAALCAINTWIRDAGSGERVGDRLVMKLKADAAGKWEGEAYDPRRKLTYAMTMVFTGVTLRTRGCVLGGVICRDVGWTRRK